MTGKCITLAYDNKELTATNKELEDKCELYTIALDIIEALGKDK